MPKYGPGVAVREHPGQADVRRFVPVLALLVLVVAVVAERGPWGYVAAGAVAVVAFAAWAWLRAPLPPMAILVVASVVVSAGSGFLEPMIFEASVLAFVVGAWIAPLRLSLPFGLLALACPVIVWLVEPDWADVSVGVWLLGIAFPWLAARAVLRQLQLAEQLEHTRRELDEQARLAERREIARDVHDLVGHGLAAMMLHVTGARHVLRRDPDAAEEGLRAAEEQGRRSMRELRQTLTLLRSDDDAIAAPVPTASDVGVLVDDARAGGLAVELRVRGDLASVDPGVGVAVYRIAQEALANAARHAPRARTVLGVERSGSDVLVRADTTGPVAAGGDGGGYGIVGMRERASALGGSLDAGPTAEGWSVVCRLPVATP
jgi:signal transduction histidine kinase